MNSETEKAVEAEETGEHTPTLEERVRDLEQSRIDHLSWETDFAGLLRRMAAAECARAEGWFKAVDSHEMRNLERLAAADGPRVDHLDCRKCGNSDVALNFCDASTYRTYRSADDKCLVGESEHFHRYCRRCTYAWRTDDVLSVRDAG